MAKSRKSEDNGVGHNSYGAIDGAALKRYVDRVVRLMEERQSLNADIKEVYEESKEAGFVTKHLRQLVKEAMMDPDVLSDHLSQMDALRAALGQFATTSLGEAAMQGAEKPKRERKNHAADAIERAKAHLWTGAVPAPFEDDFETGAPNA